MKKYLLALLTLGLVSHLGAAPTTWKADPAHSSVGFAVRHFFSKVPGTFANLDCTIVYDADNVGASKATATIGIAGVNTDNERRDGHLQTDDFFSAATYPNMTFTSTKWVKTGDNTFDITGDLTIRDVTKPVTLKAALLGTGPGPRGATLSGWEASATINRTEWGINYGAGVVGEEVEISINVEARQE